MKFCQMLNDQLRNHLVVIPNLAAGMMESHRHLPDWHLNKFMNDVLRTRIGRRVLAEQHIQLSNEFLIPPSQSPPADYPATEWGKSDLAGVGQKIGIIDANCHAGKLVQKCARLAENVIAVEEGSAIVPKVQIDGHFDTHFLYIPDHIEYIIFELLKNALRFQLQTWKLQKHQFQMSLLPPPVHLTICSSPRSLSEDLPTSSARTVTFRISDEGGGFAKSILPPENPDDIWSFSHLYSVYDQSQDLSSTGAETRSQNHIEMAGTHILSLSLSHTYIHRH
jgi:pyruvate dehydrogenase kinase 2/3/4